MTDSCCGCNAGDLSQASGAQRRALIVALVINAFMFVAEMSVGLWGHSSALQADSVDMLIDAVGLGIGLFALNRTLRARARAGFTNAFIELVLAAGIGAQLIHQIVIGALPIAAVMVGMGAVALVANLAAAGLLLRYRHEDINMRAMWLCTRNDAIGNAATIGAGVLVLVVGVPWPDWIVGALVVLLFAYTAIGMLREAWVELQSQSATNA
ncbi:cation transporter [Salinisphaera sp. SWV1]|uniref:cation transporter n=1 Tax=Salinisphaera sp. SWV1 TaxID=3454139 RepID=UPI003F86B23E